MKKTHRDEISLSRTKKLIVALLLASLALTGALRFLRPAESAVAEPETPPATALAASRPSEDSAPAPEAAKAGGTFAPDWLDRVNRIVQASGGVENYGFDMEIEALAKEVAPEDIRAALDHLIHSGADEKPLIDWLGQLIFKRWADQAPSEAAQWLASLSNGKFSSAAHLCLADAWVNTDLDGALAWMKTLPDSPHKMDVQLAIATRAAAQSDAITALELLSVLPPDPRRDQLLEHVVQVWAMKDRESALDWLNRLESPAWQEAVIGKIAVDWAVTDPMEAAQFALKSMPPGQSQENAVAISVRNWAVQAPDQAAAWIEGLSEGPLRNAAIESAAEVWAKEDPIRATEWLNSLPRGTSRDTAVGMFALTVASISPEQAARWADTIESETLRVSVRERLENQ
jgi:hypothetical protein